MEILKIEDEFYPEKLRKIKNPPQKIYVKGNIENLNNFAIAIIGTRNCTEYGERMARKFCRELVEYDVNIVSGLAKGIDSIAHSECIENNSVTIAVLPSGFNNIFPKENKKLFEKIIETGGAIITEYEPNSSAQYNNFLERNRIVSGLADGTLVIEAGQRSGTSVTARITKEQGKNVFCIPSSLENSKGIGTNNLIKKGAKLVTSVNDILNEYKDKTFEKIKTRNDIKNINKEYIDIYDILTDKPIYIEEIYRKCKLSINEINYKLMMMELEGNIVQLPGKYFVRK